MVKREDDDGDEEEEGATDLLWLYMHAVSGHTGYNTFSEKVSQHLLP